MDLGLDGKVALVAASSKGLGRASALALAREGARVTICARTAADLQAAAGIIQQETGAEVLAVPADLSTAAGIRGVVAATTERFGGVDILVNNSGGPPLGRFADFTDEDWRKAFDVVTLNFVRFIREAAPYMRTRRWGRIIGIQSSSVKQPVPGIDLSNGIRPGIAGLMKALMPDLAKDGITINLVLPGSFLTGRVIPGAGDDRRPMRSCRNSSRRWRRRSRWAGSVTRPNSAAWSRSSPPGGPPTSPGLSTRSTAAISRRTCSWVINAAGYRCTGPAACRIS
jgi:3-oxoacyl-[acyl-carrier protein] reductase